MAEKIQQQGDPTTYGYVQRDISEHLHLIFSSAKEMEQGGFHFKINAN